MCLTRLSAAPKQLSSYKNCTGWKVFHKDSSRHAVFDLIKLKSSGSRKGTWRVKLHDWMLAWSVQLSTNGNTKRFYKSGFHIYLKKPNWVPVSNIYEVTFDGVICTGYQDSRKRWPVVVAEEMFVFKK